MAAFADILSNLAQVGNPFGAPSVGQWNLSQGIFTQKEGNNPESVIFFYATAKDEPRTARTAVDQITDSGGRRLAIYEYPYRDGQAIADLGRKGETFTFNIVFHGLNYQNQFQNFLDVVVNYSGQGTLMHPVRSSSKSGALTVRFRDWEFIHQHSQWNAVAIRATFIEDATDQILKTNEPSASPDSAIRSSVQTLTINEAEIAANIAKIGLLLALPSSTINQLQQRLLTVTTQTSFLLGQLAVSFSTSALLQQLFLSASNVSGGIIGLSSGQVASTTGGNVLASLPPVFQVGFDPATQALITSQLQAFVSANTITPQQAVFSANQARGLITTAIGEINTNMGNQGYATVVLYRALAVQIQIATEQCIAQAQSLIKVYTLPSAMSLRTVAQKNGFSPDSQNVIEALNPYLQSVNYIAKGTQVIVPAA